MLKCHILQKIFIHTNSNADVSGSLAVLGELPEEWLGVQTASSLGKSSSHVTSKEGGSHLGDALYGVNVGKEYIISLTLHFPDLVRRPTLTHKVVENMFSMFPEM